MDRRQQKTKKAIFEAFNKLLEEKSYSSITVNEIIDLANIGRSTFYLHFTTKDALLKNMCKEIFDHIFSQDLQKEEIHNFSKKEKNLKNLLLHTLHHLEENKKNIRALISLPNTNLFITYLENYVAQIFEQNIDFKKINLPKEYVIYHLKTSFVRTVKWWVKSIKPHKPEVVLEYYLALHKKL